MAYVKPNTTDLSLDITVNLIRHKMVFVGDVSVGKTSIINRFVENKFNENYDVIIHNNSHQWELTSPPRLLDSEEKH